MFVVLETLAHTEERPLDGEQQSRGVIIPFGDLLIGATALWLGYSVVTGNLRHFQKIPGLSVLQI